MLYDPSRAGNASAELFRADWWRARGTVQDVPRGRGQALFVADPDRSWVLRHYRRGGLVARFLDDRYLWTGEARTRPFREWRLLHAMHAEGLPVPAPIAARYQRSGAMYRGDLITERIPRSQSLSGLLAAGPVPAAIWEAVGGCVRAFHDRGICHADLNAHNILLDAEERIFLIDFDRGRRRAPGPWRDANLARLHRSLEKVGGALPPGRLAAGDWDSLLRGYRGRAAR